MKKMVFVLLVCSLVLSGCMTMVEGGLTFADKKSVIHSSMEKRAYFEEENDAWIVDSHKDEYGYDTQDFYVTNSGHLRGVKTGALDVKRACYTDLIILEDCMAFVLYGADGKSRELFSDYDRFAIRLVGTSASMISFEDFVFNKNGYIMVTGPSASVLMQALAKNEQLRINILKRGVSGLEDSFNFEVLTSGLAPAYIRAFP